MTGDPNSPGLPKWPTFDPGSDYVFSLGQKIGPVPMNQNLRVMDKIMAADLVRGTGLIGTDRKQAD